MALFDGTIIRIIKKMRKLGDLLSGKKLTISTSIAAVAMVWSLLAPATAPSEEALLKAVAQGQDVVQAVKAHQENPVPKIIGLVGTIAALASGLHKDSKLGRAMWIAGQLAGTFLDLTSLKDPQKVVDEAKAKQNGSSSTS